MARSERQEPTEGNTTALAADPVSRLEQEMLLMRQQHSAELQALRDDLRAARQHGSAIETIAEGSIGERRRQNEKFNAMMQDVDQAPRAAWLELLDGKKGGLVGLYLGEGHTANPGIQASQSRLVCSDSGNEWESAAKYQAYFGITGISPPTKLMFIPLSDAETARIKARAMEFVDRCDWAGLPKMLGEELKAAHAKSLEAAAAGDVSGRMY